MASPQKENGHTGLANEILEVLYSSKFNGTEMKIILLVIRYTYGFQRKEASLSLRFIKDGIKTSKSVAEKYLNLLIENRVILVAQDGGFRKSRFLSFNKDYEEWQGDYQLSLSGRTVPIQEDTPSTGGHSVPIQEDSESPSTGGQRNKDIKKSFKEIALSIFQHWKDEGLKKHPKLTVHMENQIKWKLKEIEDGGENGEEVMKQSITIYSKFLKDPDVVLTTVWGLEDFLEKGHYKKFVDESEASTRYFKVNMGVHKKQNKIETGRTVKEYYGV